jgi:Coenzyme PQQ synthesis protein D (PqqD)
MPSMSERLMAEKFIARSPKIAARVLGGEMMIMSAVDSTFFSLNEVATVIFQAADGQTPLSEIVEKRVCVEFEVEPEEARRDAEVFVSELSEHGILLVSEQPIPAPQPGPVPPSNAGAQ